MPKSALVSFYTHLAYFTLKLIIRYTVTATRFGPLSSPRAAHYASIYRATVMSSDSEGRRDDVALMNGLRSLGEAA